MRAAGAEKSLGERAITREVNIVEEECMIEFAARSAKVCRERVWCNIVWCSMWDGVASGSCGSWVVRCVMWYQGRRRLGSDVSWRGEGQE